MQKHNTNISASSVPAESRGPSLTLWDWGAAILLAVAGVAAYTYTLAPTVLDGDAALFQYTPHVLGITYPTGFPTYVLFGHLWQVLVPAASVAYRMNLLSAVCGGLVLAFWYIALIQLLESRIAALSAVAIFATLPSYWLWSTKAKTYTLHILLLSLIIFFLGRGANRNRSRLSPGVKSWLFPCLLLALIALGFALGNHNTTILLAPGLFLLYWLEYRHSMTPTLNLRSWQGILKGLVYLLPITVLPLLLYSFVPLRANHLLAQEGSLIGLTVPVAVARGLVADFYQPGLTGLVRYFSAADFTSGVVTNWGLIPQKLLTVYWPLLQQDFTLWGALLGGLGAVYFAFWRPRRFWPLFLMYVVLIPFVLTYNQGEQTAFLLPSSLMLSIFCGAAVAGGLRLIKHWLGKGLSTQSRKTVRPVFSSLLQIGLVAVVAWLPIHHIRQNITWLTSKWDDASYQYWTTALAHPMQEGAGILAHWGDLTTFWYLQHAEGTRPDLYGLYPPSQEVIDRWLEAGHPLYVAGPLQDWVEGLTDRYQLMPWGRLVQIAPLGSDPFSLLPVLPAAPPGAIFDDRLLLLKSDHVARTSSGGILPVTLAWQTTGSLPTDLRISLRLVTEDGIRIAQDDDTLFSGWLPASELSEGQAFVTYHRFRVPAGTLPGTYNLQIALFQPHQPGLALPDGNSVLELGAVTIGPADLSGPLDPWDEYKDSGNVNFDNQIRLVGYDYSVTRARQGKGFALQLLWQAIRSPDIDNTLLVEMVDKDGQVLRDWYHVPENGRAPTASWEAGQLVRDQVDLVLPANAPTGENSVDIQISWVRPDGSRLPVRRWGLPAGETFTLPGVWVLEKEDRSFEPPVVQFPTEANFDNKAQLIGYDLAASHLPGDTVPLTLVWRSNSSEMREPYTVFIHMVGPDGTIYAQQDKMPGWRSKQPTTSWVAGEVITDPISIVLPSDLPEGTYRLDLGLYLAPDGPRLPLLDNSGTIKGEKLELAQIEITTP